MEYITKKIPRHLAGKIRWIQAKMTLKRGEKVTEGDVVGLALSRLEAEMEKEKGETRHTLRELAGSLKGKARSDWKDINKVVYGI